jgi:uncharacterized Zn-finger protein
MAANALEDVNSRKSANTKNGQKNQKNQVTMGSTNSRHPINGWQTPLPASLSSRRFFICRRESCGVRSSPGDAT